ncbi:hypothetical protein EAI35_07795 [Enterobacter bugandensis]|nr:hypothetical protein EAI35_07795 [Enterobacter bugandensis]
MITFNASHKDAEITECLRKRGYEKKTLNGYDISFNTYIGTVDCDFEINENGSFSSLKLKKNLTDLLTMFEKILKIFLK